MIERTLKEFNPTDISWARNIKLAIEFDGERGRVWFSDSLTGTDVYYKNWGFGAPRRWWRPRPMTMTDALFVGVQYYDAAVARYHRSVEQAEIAKETLDAAAEVIASL